MKTKSYIYRSTMSKYTDVCDFFAREVGKDVELLVHILWTSYSIRSLLDSSYFQILRVGDAKYTLIVQRYPMGDYKVTLTINEYGNINENFTN